MKLYAMLGLAYNCSPVTLWAAPPDLLEAMVDTVADQASRS